MVLAALPHIQISPAPPDESLPEPYTPFSWANTTLDDHDGYRPKHLTPPPTNVKFNALPSPLRPAPTPGAGKGLERERFEALLQATRERNATGSAKKSGDLRKEIALKVHKNKQVERRALFLSKVLAPPSPTATLQPKTPPDSPAIFHYSLPSPGLVSPLALFESLNDTSTTGPLTYAREPWVEQVDFRTRRQSGLKAADKPVLPVVTDKKATKTMPSLEEISARLGQQGHTRTPSNETVPRFSMNIDRPSADRPRLALGVGRLQMPQPQQQQRPVATFLPPKSPLSPLSPKIEVRTMVVPRSSSLSPTELSESNLNALASRERKARNMLSTIRRRMLPSDDGLNGHDLEIPDQRKWKRRSAPAEFSPRPRSGFEHPVLSIPGGF
ncbi:hypothetical protein D9758_002420 [Tetrapyrgos nigripes]|uniref:Uncharacterized protein n=1 Tax=Tetrapyrgos nigripes TaxID=182062 RepID=A0A8H5GNX8_9AGAR|nr:hypothetical protein D9758_002420 [Tetrapyrgos nigripes]